MHVQAAQDEASGNVEWKKIHPYLGKISNLTIIFFKRVETTN